jgi:hypothetical protein
MSDDDKPTSAESLADAAEGIGDPERLRLIAALAEQVNANPLPEDQAERVRRWRAQARTAATSAEGDDGN